jgi:alcohol dehydrogenase
VLRALFDEVDGRRHLLAEGFGVSDGDATDAELAERVVDAVAGVRDDLGLPSQLREIDGLSRSDFRGIADVIVDDSFLDDAPAGLELTVDDVEAVLEAAW